MPAINLRYVRISLRIWFTASTIFVAVASSETSSTSTMSGKNCFRKSSYELVLIGQCSGTARTFINSIEKYRINQMDKKSTEALAGFDTTILDHAAISVRSLSDDLFSLQAHMRDSLSKYLEGERLLLSYSQIDFIVRAMIADQLLQSTKGEYTDRYEYDKELKKRITLIKQRYFNDFLSNIRLPDSLREELKKAHTELREHLKSDDITKDLLVDSFLQGSYARATCIKPEKGHKADVDVIVVTNIDHA